MDMKQLRPIVFNMLLQKPETNFREVEDKIIHNISDYYSRDDTLKLYDIFWELLIQGMIAPGFNSSNLELPWIHVTEYGKRCLEKDSILPHDPDGYVERLKHIVGQPLDSTVLTYVQESLSTFLGGYWLASTVMLGVASEQCVDLLTEAYLNAIVDPSHKGAFEKKLKQAGRSVKNRFDSLRDELLKLGLPSDLKDALDIQLSGIFTLIRFSRNDAGHPTGRTVDRDLAHGNLLLFPQYCRRVYELIDHFKTNPVQVEAQQLTAV
jgi:hypothetical protein